MVDFRQRLSPEARAQLEACERHHAQKVAEVQGLDDEAFAAYIEANVENCETLSRWRAGDPVYEATLAYVIIPEVIRRLRGYA